MKLHLENGNTVTLDAPENSADNRYIGSMYVNGHVYDRNYLTHDDLMKGAYVNYRMISEPNTERGATPSSFPYSVSTELTSPR